MSILANLIKVVSNLYDTITTNTSTLTSLTNAVNQLNEKVGDPSARITLKSTLQPSPGLCSNPANLILPEAAIEFQYQNAIYAGLDQATQEKVKVLMDETFLANLKELLLEVKGLEYRITQIDNNTKLFEQEIRDRINSLVASHSSGVVKKYLDGLDKVVGMEAALNTALYNVSKTQEAIDKLKVQLSNTVQAEQPNTFKRKK